MNGTTLQEMLIQLREGKTCVNREEIFIFKRKMQFDEKESKTEKGRTFLATGNVKDKE